MPRSIFLGRVVQPGEPLWLEEDRAWALALADVEGELCPGGCGQPVAESTAVGADEAYDVKFTQCHACATIARRTEDRGNRGELIHVIKGETPRGLTGRH